MGTACMYVLLMHVSYECAYVLKFTDDNCLKGKGLSVMISVLPTNKTMWILIAVPSSVLLSLPFFPLPI